MALFDVLHSAQISWFAAKEIDFDGVVARLEKMLGVPPNQVARLAPPSAAIPTKLASFQTGESVIRLQAVTGRSDIFVLPPETQNIGTLPIDKTIQYVESFFPLCELMPVSFRQALNIKVGKRIDSDDVGREIFKALLSTDADLSGATDLSFQLNKRIEVDGIEINRVLRWFVEEAQILQVGDGHQRVLETARFVSYLNDINTVPTSVERDAGEQKRAFSALANVLVETLKLKSIGDIK